MLIKCKINECLKILMSKISYKSPSCEAMFHLENGRIVYESAATYSNKMKAGEEFLSSWHCCTLCSTVLFGEDTLSRHYQQSHKDSVKSYKSLANESVHLTSEPEVKNSNGGKKMKFSKNIVLPSLDAQDEFAPLPPSQAEAEAMDANADDPIFDNDTDKNPHSTSTEEIPELAHCELDDLVTHETMPRLSTFGLHSGPLLKRNKFSENSCDEEMEEKKKLDLINLRGTKWFWCKVCNDYLPSLDELRLHVIAEHEIDASQINEFNYATYDLEIARTIQSKD